MVDFGIGFGQTHLVGEENAVEAILQPESFAAEAAGRDVAPMQVVGVGEHVGPVALFAPSAHGLQPLTGDAHQAVVPGLNELLPRRAGAALGQYGLQELLGRDVARLVVGEQLPHTHAFAHGGGALLGAFGHEHAGIESHAFKALEHAAHVQVDEHAAQVED